MKRYLKRAASILIAVVMLFGSAVFSGGLLMQNAFADKSYSELESRYEDGYEYTVDNGEARIWCADKTVTGDVVIPSKLGGYPVTAICISFPFAYESEITSAVIPSGVRTIKRNAFSYCRKLTSVTIPDTVTLIEAFAFEETALTDIYYEGSESDWAQIDIKNNRIDGYNFELRDATIHYNTKIKGSGKSGLLDFGKDDPFQTQDNGESKEANAIGIFMVAIGFIAFCVIFFVVQNNGGLRSWRNKK